MHKDAPLAHVASLAAHEQGKFWEYHDLLFEKKKLKRDNLLEYANELGLDMAKFEAALLDDAKIKAVNADVSEARGMGATGTPAFFVNGRFLSGAKPFEDFAKLINAELTKNGLPVPPEAVVQ